MVLQPVRFTLPYLSPNTRCALTTPFHLYLKLLRGTIFSVALSVISILLLKCLPFQGARRSMLSGLSSPSKLGAIRRPVSAKLRQKISVAQPPSHLFHNVRKKHHKSSSGPSFPTSYKSLPVGGPAPLRE